MNKPITNSKKKGKATDTEESGSYCFAFVSQPCIITEVTCSQPAVLSFCTLQLFKAKTRDRYACDAQQRNPNATLYL